MTSAEHAARPSVWAKPRPVRDFILDTFTIVRAELLKVRHDLVETFTRATIPLLWLVVFGQVMTQTRAIPAGSIPYIDYLAPGVLAQSAQFSAIFFGPGRDLGA